MFERDRNGNTKLGESRHLKDLNKVVDSERALEQFRIGRSLEEALIYTDFPVITYRDLLEKAKANISNAQTQLNLVRDGLNEDDNEILKDIIRLVRDVAYSLKGRLSEIRDNDTINDDV